MVHNAAKFLIECDADLDRLGPQDPTAQAGRPPAGLHKSTALSNSSLVHTTADLLVALVSICTSPPVATALVRITMGFLVALPLNRTSLPPSALVHSSVQFPAAHACAGKLPALRGGYRRTLAGGRRSRGLTFRPILNFVALSTSIAMARQTSGWSRSSPRVLSMRTRQPS